MGTSKKVYVVRDLQTVLKAAGADLPVQTITLSNSSHAWHMEPLEVTSWQGGLLVYPWTQDAAAGALIHDAEYQLTVVRQKEIDQLQALADKYGYEITPSIREPNPRIQWENNTQLIVINK